MRSKNYKRNKINVITLGCSKNIYDSEILMGQLAANNIDVEHESSKENANIILTFLEDGISRIKINDSSNYNALSSKNISSLIDIFRSLNNDNKTKVIIIEGAGKGFSAGHDLKEIRKNFDNFQKSWLSNRKNFRFLF